LVTGQGADELFHGYAHFRGLSLADRLSRASADLERLTEHEWPRFQRMSAGAGRQIVAPYLDDEFVRAVQREASSIAVASEGEPKRTLRELARHLGVPAELAARPKKAMQYGSGIGRLVREFDRAAAGTRGG
ncbi:MAG TPA: asparagine synthase-related protein, partial [Thermoplasmata archaeon]|nr:asparagine synthase-related protein [Thermoplasmata archaeon]